MVIGRDGTISIRPQGGGTAELVTLDRILLVNPAPDQLAKGDDGLLRMKDGSQAEPDAFVQVISGALESSNVNTVEAMVNMIEYARGFEAQTKFLKVAESVDEASSRLMRQS
jgi:flagellar basal-body rod protein FlgF